MRALGIVGWSGAGKTTLITAILPLLTARGLRVATVKHTHHAFDLDRPGKDSHRHRAAGAAEVLLVGGERWALLHEGAPPPLDRLLARLQPADLVLVEGFRAAPLPKIEVFRAGLGRPRLWPERSDIVALAADPVETPPDRAGLPLSDPGAVADWIADWLAAWRAAGDAPP
jgi:molybdopterin-guanine dinucleotide biosynthesis protein B